MIWRDDIGKLWFDAGVAWRAASNAPVDATVPQSHWTVGGSERALAAQFVEASGIAKFFGENASVEVWTARAELVHESTIEEFESPDFVELFWGREAIQDEMAYGA